MVRNGTKIFLVDNQIPAMDRDSDWIVPSALTAIVYMLAPSTWASGCPSARRRPENGPYDRALAADPVEGTASQDTGESLILQERPRCGGRRAVTALRYEIAGSRLTNWAGPSAAACHGVS